MGKRLRAEEILEKLWEVEVRLTRGETTAAVERAFGATEQRCYRWRKEYGSFQVGQAEHLRRAL